MGFRQIKGENYLVGIWHAEPMPKGFGMNKKESENAGKNQLIRHIFPDHFHEWNYEESGKPYFLDRSDNLSFSHSENVYACQISDSIICGIDVQHYKEKILRLPDKFLNVNELEFITQVDEESKVKTLTAMWSCKEALYKMYGRGFIDYINLFTIHPFEPITGMLQATADLGEGDMDYYFHVEFTEGYVLAFHTLSPLLSSDE